MQPLVTLTYLRLDSQRLRSQKEELYQSLVDKLYEKGKAIEAAAHLEIDAVIDPSETRKVILKAQELRQEI